MINNNKKKRTWKIVDFAVSADRRVKLKECEMKDKHLDLARELKKDLEIEGRMETIQNALLLISARILRRALETWDDFLSLKLQWETISVS